MIAISGLLVVIAFVTLIVGVFQSGLGMIYVSIAASVAAAVTLATGVMRSRPKAVAVSGPEPLGTWGGTATPVLDQPVEESSPEEAPLSVVEEAESTTQVLRLEEPEEEPYEEPIPEPAPRRVRTSSPARARKTAAKPTAAKGAKKTAAKASAPRTAAGSVVVVPGRDKYHKDACRYVQGQVTQTITKAAAKREGYKACGVCKP